MRQRTQGALPALGAAVLLFAACSEPQKRPHTDGPRPGVSDTDGTNPRDGAAHRDGPAHLDGPATDQAASGADGGKTSQLDPPSEPFPASKIGGAPKTFNDPKTFTVAAFEKALAAGGIVRLGPGTFDISGIKAPVLDGVRIEGAGKHATVLRGGFSLADYRTKAHNDVFGWVKGRVELADLTIDRVRAVLVGRGTGAGKDWPSVVDSDGFRILDDDRPSMGAAPTFGIYWRSVRVTRSGRAVMLVRLDRFKNVFWHNVDNINMWHSFAIQCENASSDWYFYNCYWEDMIVPDSPDQGTLADWDNIASGVRMGDNITQASQGKAQNIRFEHCTFNGLTSNYKPGASYNVAVYAFRGGGMFKDCWFKRCRFLNIGYDRNGKQLAYEPMGNGITYSKGKLYFENIVVENCSAGNEGMFNTKGGQVSQWGIGTDDFNNIYVKGVHPSRDGHVASIIGPHPWGCTIDNLHAEDVEVKYGVTSPGYSATGHARGDIVIKNVTVKRMRLTSDSGTKKVSALPFHSTGIKPYPSFRLENILVQDFEHARGALAPAVFVAGAGADDPFTSIRARDLRLDLTGNGYSSAGLVKVDGKPGTIDGEPTGEIVGVKGTTYSKFGKAVADTQLAPYGGTVTGADLSWMTSGTPIGCDPTR